MYRLQPAACTSHPLWETLSSPTKRTMSPGTALASGQMLRVSSQKHEGPCGEERVFNAYEVRTTAQKSTSRSIWSMEALYTAGSSESGERDFTATQSNVGLTPGRRNRNQRHQRAMPAERVSDDAHPIVVEQHRDGSASVPDHTVGSACVGHHDRTRTQLRGHLERNHSCFGNGLRQEFHIHRRLDRERQSTRHERRSSRRETGRGSHGAAYRRGHRRGCIYSLLASQEQRAEETLVRLCRQSHVALLDPSGRFSLTQHGRSRPSVHVHVHACRSTLPIVGTARESELCRRRVLHTGCSTSSNAGRRERPSSSLVLLRHRWT